MNNENIRLEIRYSSLPTFTFEHGINSLVLHKNDHKGSENYIFLLFLPSNFEWIALKNASSSLVLEYSHFLVMD